MTSEWRFGYYDADTAWYMAEGEVAAEADLLTVTAPGGAAVLASPRPATRRRRRFTLATALWWRPASAPVNRRADGPPARLVFGPINQALEPRLAKACSRNDPDVAAAITCRTAQLGLVAGTDLVVCYLVFGRFFLSLFWHEYEDAAGTLPILIFGPGPMAITMSGAERLAALLNTVGLVAGLPVGFLLYRSHGIEGLA